MDDFDFEDWFTGSSYVEPGIPISIPDISVSDLNLGSLDLADAFNFGDVLGSLDLSDALNFGDLSGIVDLGPTKYDYLSNIDYGYGVPSGIQDLIPETTYTREGTPFIPRDVDVIRDISDIIPETTYTKETTPFVPRDVNVIRDISDVVPETTYTKEQTPFTPGTAPLFDFGYGEAPLDPREIDGLQGSRTEGTALKSFGIEPDPFEIDGAQGSRTEGTALQGFGIETDPYGVDGLQGSRTEQTALTGTTPGGKDVIKTEPPKTPTTPTTGTTGTKTVSDIFKDLLGGKDPALLMALLGGLLGLLGRKSAPQLPVGYQGGIPKFKTIRGKPGEGITMEKTAAGGGLMDLAQGGRPARYLRGGTDGMADKIKTDIDGKQPARLSHGEFVIPADVVSHLGNGNSDAGADVLYDMMAKVRKARTGTTKQGKQINPRKMIPA
jgi:hypothetical protein